MVDLKFKYKTGNVPQLSNIEIETHATALLQDYNPSILHSPQALDVEDFVENYLKFDIHYTNLSHNGFIWGRMVFNNTMMVVWDSNTHQADEEPIQANTVVIDNGLLENGKEHIFRSTMAHEAGHGIYHPEYFYFDKNIDCDDESSHPPYTRCKENDVLGGEIIKGKRRLISDHDWLEHQAKYFSAAILMNKTAMRTLCHSKDVKEYCFDTNPEFVNDEMILMVSRVFNVSPTSAKIRLEQLKLIIPGANDSEFSFFRSGRMLYSPVFAR